MRSRILVVVVMVFVALASMTGIAPGQQAAPAVEPGKSPLAGVLVISLAGIEQYSSTIGEARIERIADRTFITGVGVDTGDPDWTIGQTVRIPLDGITHVVQFADVEKYAQAKARHRR